MTYAEFLVVLSQFSGESIPGAAGAWYQGYVDWAENAGLVPDEMGSFNPDASITRAEVEALLAGDLEILRRGDDPLRLELYGRMRGTLLRPRVIVDYKRIPYLFPAGNVRITLDSDIRTGLASLDFFSPDATRLSASDCYGLLEVKYDAFLPDWIAGLVRMGDRPAAAFSKYALARRYD